MSIWFRTRPTYFLEFLSSSSFCFLFEIDDLKYQLPIDIEATFHGVWKWRRLKLAASIRNNADNASASKQLGWEIETVQRSCIDTLVPDEQHSLHG